MQQDEMGSAEHSTQGTPTLPAALTCSPLTRHTTYPTPLHSQGLIFLFTSSRKPLAPGQDGVPLCTHESALSGLPPVHHTVGVR